MVTNWHIVHAENVLLDTFTGKINGYLPTEFFFLIDIIFQGPLKKNLDGGISSPAIFTVLPILCTTIELTHLLDPPSVA